MNATETIIVKSGPELQQTANRIAAERGLKQRTHRGHGYGLAPIGPSVGLYDEKNNEVVRVTFDNR